MKKIIIWHLLFILLLISGLVHGQSFKKVMNISGDWKFMIGDNAAYIKPEYNDSDWEELSPRLSWEDQSFSGYNGFAWYRKAVVIDSSRIRGTLLLALGRIDDVDEVFFNGVKIGQTGSFPPNYSTAYHQWRKYIVPLSLVRFGKANLIAIRVYDGELAGGMIEGNTGLICPDYDIPLRLDMYLDGYWKFTTGDFKDYAKNDYRDSHWKDIIVPGTWESQGYYDYDGIAWYRKKFFLPQSLKKEALVLVMGKIDDYDEVRLNGILIGKTGNMSRTNNNTVNTEEWMRLRGYYIPETALNRNGENVISVRVFDGFKDGGIYEGPIGLITQTKYSLFWNSINE